MVLSNFKKFQFLAPIFGRGAWGFLKTPKKVDPPGGPDYSAADSKSKLSKYSVKDFSVASEVTSGIDHRHTDPMSICLESQSAFQCLLLYPVLERYDIVDFVKSVSW